MVREQLVEELRSVRSVANTGMVPNVPTNHYVIPNTRDLVHGSFKGLVEAFQRYVKAHEDLQALSPTAPDYMSKAEAAMHITQDYLSAAENYTATLGVISGAR